ncbi:MAG TPA: DUF2937 family protein [Microvirga sp.]|nr:DUF2937 family protein [Microvirga sp.]
MSRIVRIVAFGLGLVGAVIASQAPEFAQQYRQRLGGAIDELRRVIEQFDADALANGETRETAIQRLRGNPDDLASRQGAAMQGNVERLARLEGHRQVMLEAGPFSRIGLLLREGDTDLMWATYHDYKPALPVTEEGLLSAAAGFVGAWGGLLLLASFIRSLWPRRRRRPVLRA